MGASDCFPELLGERDHFLPMCKERNPRVTKGPSKVLSLKFKIDRPQGAQLGLDIWILDTEEIRDSPLSLGTYHWEIRYVNEKPKIIVKAMGT